MMSFAKLLAVIADSPPVLTEQQSVVFGHAYVGGQLFHLLGVSESTFLGVEQALIMAEQVIGLIESKSHAPVLLLVDVAGQQLTMRDEWLGMNQYFAHLLTSLAHLRQQGNRLIALVYNQAVGGSFIAYGLMADTILALPQAKLAVMWLEGMAKITKIDLDRLEQLSAAIPVFAPGVTNFYQLGGLHEIVTLENIPAKLVKAAQLTDVDDNRAQLGYERGGRQVAWSIIKEIALLS
jgi:malonate decarboxylase gamma subunit